MSEGLDNFIRNRRKEFDEMEPPQHIWENIEQHLDKQGRSVVLKHRFSIIVRIAAIVLVVLASALLFLNYQQNKAVNISSIDPHLAQQSIHYAAVIETRRSELEEIKEQNPGLYKEFSSELEKLDKTYQKLKKELDTSPNQELTLKAMVLNLQIQAQVLNQQLNIIEQIKQFKEGNQHEKRSI